MPRLIEHIDVIARKKQSGVFFISFHPERSIYDDSPMAYQWKNDPVRKMICEWLTEQHIAWQSCNGIASESFMSNYRGQVYLDIPCDENNEQYKLANDFLENPDGSNRFDNVNFWQLPLEVAMQNAHHDEPDFWSKWAENF